MGTRSNRKLRKCVKGSHKKRRKEDLFSRLSDDIIVSHILSRLSLKEGSKLSTLSHRWKNLWANTIGFTPKLSVVPNCNNRRYLDMAESRNDEFRDMTRKFVTWVHHILELHQIPTLDEFKLCFDLDENSSLDINGWLNFAFRKGVKRLELDLSTPCRLPTKQCPYLYTLYDISGILKISASPASGILNLRELRLKFVEVDQEFVDYVLSHCPFLERLGLWNTMQQELKVCGQSLGLKCLEIFDRIDFPMGSFSTTKSVEISAPNITPLLYHGEYDPLHLKHIPLLSELSIGGTYCSNFLRTCAKNFSFLSQLKVLTLMLSPLDVKDSFNHPLEFSELTNLEHLQFVLTLKLEILNRGVEWVNFKFHGMRPEDDRYDAEEPTYYIQKLVKKHREIRKAVRRSEIEAATKRVHPCLKAVQLSGFDIKERKENVMELYQHLCEIVPQLQRWLSVYHPLSLVAFLQFNYADPSIYV